MITCENVKNIVRPKEQKRKRGRGRGSESGRILTDEHGLIDFACTRDLAQLQFLWPENAKCSRGKRTAGWLYGLAACSGLCGVKGSVRHHCDKERERGRASGTTSGRQVHWNWHNAQTAEMLLNCWSLLVGIQLNRLTNKPQPAEQQLHLSAVCLATVSLCVCVCGVCKWVCVPVCVYHGVFQSVCSCCCRLCPALLLFYHSPPPPAPLSLRVLL